MASKQYQENLKKLAEERKNYYRLRAQQDILLEQQGQNFQIFKDIKKVGQAKRSIVDYIQNSQNHTDFDIQTLDIRTTLKQTKDGVQKSQLDYRQQLDELVRFGRQLRLDDLKEIEEL